MDYVTVRELREQSGTIWDRVQAGEEMVITRNGKPFAVVAPTVPSAVEDTVRALRLQRFGRAVTELRRQAGESGAHQLTDAEIEAEIAAVRKTRREHTDNRR